MALPDGRPVLTVIFGAGASYGSWTLGQNGATLPDETVARVPLTAELFAGGRFQSEFKTKYSPYGLNGLIPRIQGANDLEARLEQLLNDAAGRPHEGRLMSQVMALRFYLRDLLKAASEEWLRMCCQVTAYSALLDQIESWRLASGATVNLVSFNYEGLLERAAGSVLRWSPLAAGEDLSGYVSHENYRLYKVHGSVDWQQELEAPLDAERASDPVRSAVDLAPTLSQTEGCGYLPWPSDSLLRGRPITVGTPAGCMRIRLVPVPAIAVPTLGKAEFACPPSHLADLKQRLPRSDRIISVGWRGRDNHFLDLWRAALELPPHESWSWRPPHVLSIGKSEAPEVAQCLDDVYWATAPYPDNRKSKLTLPPCDFSGGFADAVHQETVYDWLNGNASSA